MKLDTKAAIWFLVSAASTGLGLLPIAAAAATAFIYEARKDLPQKDDKESGE